MKPLYVKVLAALLVAILCGPVARAAEPEPKKFFLIDGTVTEKRVADLEARVAELERQLRAATKAPCVCGDGCKCAAGECPAKCPVAAAPPPSLVGGGVGAAPATGLTRTSATGRVIRWTGTHYEYADGLPPPATYLQPDPASLTGRPAPAAAPTCTNGTCRVR